MEEDQEREPFLVDAVQLPGGFGAHPRGRPFPAVQVLWGKEGASFTELCTLLHCALVCLGRQAGLQEENFHALFDSFKAGVESVQKVYTEQEVLGNLQEDPGSQTP